MRDSESIFNKILIIRRNIIKTLSYAGTHARTQSNMEDKTKIYVHLTQKMSEYYNNNKKSETIEIMKKLREM